MCLAGSTFTDEQDRFSTIDVAALGQVAHLRRGHIRRLRVIELLQRLHAWQMRFPDSALDGVPFPFFHLGQQQRLQIPDVVFLFQRITCSANVPNCEAIIGMRRVLQWALIVASCNCAAGSPRSAAAGRRRSNESGRDHNPEQPIQVRWQRGRFRRFWARLSRPRCRRRGWPATAAEIRRLIKQMAAASGAQRPFCTSTEKPCPRMG